jgi:hypothetical protein
MTQWAKTNLGDRVPLDVRVNELELSVRPACALHNEGIETLRELVTKTEAELMRIPNFGRKSLREVVEALADFDLRLNDAAPINPNKAGSKALDKLSEEMADALLHARAAKEVYTEAVAKVQRIAKRLIHVSLEEDL